MEKSSAFIVQFSGLKLGKHNFEFVVDDTFFEKLDYSQVKHGEIEVNIELEKKSSMLILNFSLNGWLGENCDRCAVDYQQKLTGEHQVYVKFGDDYDELDDKLLVIPRESYEFDVSQLIYEFIQLNIPLKKVPCEEEDGNTKMCDQETLQVLEASKAEEEENTNPMWVAMNKIKDQLD
jgi:uncharacterized metal-binding protein YceD (DUF177 family)